MVLDDKDQDEDRKVDANAPGEVVTIEPADKKVAGAADDVAVIEAGDERLANTEEDGEEGIDVGAIANETQEEKRARRKQERDERENRQRRARERDRREMQFLRRRNEDLEKKFSAFDQRQTRTEAMQIDERISQFDAQIAEADRIISKAIDEQQGSTATEAQGIRDRLRTQRDRWAGAKEQLARRAADPNAGKESTREERTTADPELIQHAAKWTEKNKWFDHRGADEDSAIAKIVDDKLAADGFDPTTEEYWNELDKRLAVKLPHRYRQAVANGAARVEQREQQRPPQLANGSRERALKPGEMYVSPERKQALIDAGVWDDVPTRNRYLKRYADYDTTAKQNSSRRA